MTDEVRIYITDWNESTQMMLSSKWGDRKKESRICRGECRESGVEQTLVFVDAGHGLKLGFGAAAAALLHAKEPLFLRLSCGCHGDLAQGRAAVQKLARVSAQSCRPSYFINSSGP